MRSRRWSLKWTYTSWVPCNKTRMSIPAFPDHSALSSTLSIQSAKVFEVPRLSPSSSPDNSGSGMCLNAHLLQKSKRRFDLTAGRTVRLLLLEMMRRWSDEETRALPTWRIGRGWTIIGRGVLACTCMLAGTRFVCLWYLARDNKWSPTWLCLRVPACLSVSFYTDARTRTHTGDFNAVMNYVG